MIKQSFNLDWHAGPKQHAFASFSGVAPDIKPVTLPYDAIRDRPRSADSAQGSHTAYYPGGPFEYTKTFDVPAEWHDKAVIVEFEGVYRDAMVYVNGEFAAQRPSGYAGFAIKAEPYLRYGQSNTIAVQARAHEDSRWYTGAGIYRNTHIIVTDPVHVALDGVRITTPDVDAERAVVAVATTVENDSRFTRTVRLDTRIIGAGGTVVANGSAPVTLLPGTSAVSRTRLFVASPALWSPDSPALYEVHTTVTAGDDLLDEDRSCFGIRTLQLDPRHGLRINGTTIDLRGACVHHDNGPLGSAAISRAEERRVEILKAAGFNAIRSSHNPLSRAMLDACDRLGMLVMDELTDIWTEGKSTFDYSLAFPEWWERDLEAMIAKDFNHPSVIMYSIGNEIFEVGTPIGSSWGRRLAEKARSLDDTRFVTNALNGLVAMMDRLGEMMGGGNADQQMDVNTMMASMGEMMRQLSTSNAVTQATEESASVLDIVGFNYAETRYELDAVQFPNRVMVGSETFPNNIDELWRLVRANSHVIGDFTWTGWDYLGEAGIGSVAYTDEPGFVPGLAAPYPYLVASAGDIDITGHRRTVSYYRETVFGLRRAPYIAVHRPQFHGRPTTQSPWSWTDSVSSWSWDVPAGSPTTVDVYSDADEIELLLNGSSIGRAPVGQPKPFIARFEVQYEAGELIAVAYTVGEEQTRTVLLTANDSLRVHAAADRTAIRADDTDLAYIEITLQDADGNLANNRDRPVAVTVDGPGVLAALGTGCPSTEETFHAATRTTYDGRALAIVRPIGAGDITVTVTAEGLEPVTLHLRAGDEEGI